MRTQLFLFPTTALKRCSSRILFLAITSFYRFPNAILCTPTIYKQPLICIYNPSPSTGQTPSGRYSKLTVSKLILFSVFFLINELHYYPSTQQPNEGLQSSFIPLTHTLLTNPTDPCSVGHFPPCLCIVTSIGTSLDLHQPIGKVVVSMPSFSSLIYHSFGQSSYNCKFYFSSSTAYF